MTQPEARTGVCVIRAWREGEAHTLRARITHTLDISLHDEVTVTVAGTDALRAAFAEWLDEFERDSELRREGSGGSAA